MNEKIMRQVEEMKKQTIGVEVEMNGISREKAARIAARYFGTQQDGTDTAPGQHGMQKDGNGNSRRMSALQDRTAKNANWSLRSLLTQIWKPCRNSSGNFGTQGQRAMPPEDAEYTSTSEPKAIRRRRSATLQTSWQAMRA